MSVGVALDCEKIKKLYPFCNLSDAANILIMPNLEAADIAYKLIKQLAIGSLIGPMLIGANKPIQILHMNASTADVVNAAVWSASEATYSKN